jgi:hypothetical protein
MLLSLKVRVWRRICHDHGKGKGDLWSQVADYFVMRLAENSWWYILLRHRPPWLLHSTMLIDWSPNISISESPFCHKRPLMNLVVLTKSSLELWVVLKGAGRINWTYRYEAGWSIICIVDLIFHKKWCYGVPESEILDLSYTDVNSSDFGSRLVSEILSSIEEIRISYVLWNCFKIWGVGKIEIVWSKVQKEFLPFGV